MSKLRTIAALAWVLAVIPLHADVLDFQIFNTQQAYSAVLLQQGRVQLDADWNEETAGAIHQGQVFGMFSFEFDPAAVQPVVGSGIVSGLAVGAAPDGSFGSDQGISLVVEPGLAVTAFGAEIVYAPFNGEVNSDVFRLIVDCPHPPCGFAGNLANLNLQGGTLFLGIIAGPGSEFTKITMEAVSPNDDSVVPKWQLDAIAFSPVPEPSTGALVAASLCGVAALRRRVARTLPTTNAVQSDARMLVGNQHGCAANRDFSCNRSAESRI